VLNVFTVQYSVVSVHTMLLSSCVIDYSIYFLTLSLATNCYADEASTCPTCNNECRQNAVTTGTVT